MRRQNENFNKYQAMPKLLTTVTILLDSVYIFKMSFKLHSLLFFPTILKYFRIKKKFVHKSLLAIDTLSSMRMIHTFCSYHLAMNIIYSIKLQIIFFLSAKIQEENTLNQAGAVYLSQAFVWGASASDPQTPQQCKSIHKFQQLSLLSNGGRFSYAVWKVLKGKPTTELGKLANFQW